MSRPTALATPAGLQGRWTLTQLPRWIKLLAAGAALWGLSVGVLLVTSDRYVLGPVVLGTLLVPLALATRFADGDKLAGVDGALMIRLSVGGGLLGFLTAAFLEHPMISQPASVFDGWVGVIEETSKLAVLAFMTRRVVHRAPSSGFVLGGLVGLGFAAFESAGYALNSAISSGGNSHAVIAMVIVRAATTPFTHGLWTAVTGAALFASTRDRRFRVAPLLLVTLIAVATLHAGWDLMPNLAADMASWLVGSSAGPALNVEVNLLAYSGQAVLSLPALYVAYRLRRHPRHIHATQAPVPRHQTSPVALVDRSAA